MHLKLVLVAALALLATACQLPPTKYTKDNISALKIDKMISADGGAQFS